MKKHGGRSHGAPERKRKGRPGIMIEGVFSAASRGAFGFIRPENGGPDVFVPPSGVGSAVDGDNVSAEMFEPDASGYIHGHPSKGPVGYIRAVLGRGRESLVARMSSSHAAQPLDSRLPDEIEVHGGPRGIKSGDWVRVRLLKDGSKHTEKLRGGVEERLGRSGTAEGDLNAVAAEFHLEGPYSPEQEAAALKLKPRDIERTDLRDHFTVTIDPADAHDFDDAVSIMPGGPNEVLVGVHIADVAAWIRPGSAFDKLAAKRAFSAYLPGRFLPMLPASLTQKISLRENQDSPAHSILFSIRRNDGKILSSRRVHSLIRVTKRLAFPEVRDFLAGGTAPASWDRDFCEKIRLLGVMAQRLRARRMRAEQFLDMELPETRAAVDEKTGEVTAIERREQSDADRLVEEFMLAANSAAASEIQEKHLPGLYRVHPEPDPAKIDDFSAFVQQVFEFSPGDILASRKACRRFLESLPDDHRKPVILSAFLRALPRAFYTAECALHYGLGKNLYSHFTSPIRRYPDLLLHQQLWSADTNARLKSAKTLDALAVYCSKKEENNDNAFFAANDRMKILYLKQHRALSDGKLYEAVIARVSSSGLFCDIPELGIYGFVPASLIRGGGFRRSRPGRGRAEGSHTEYKPGDFVYLILDSLDTAAGRAVFRPAM